jgi:hypothetical protein
MEFDPEFRETTDTEKRGLGNRAADRWKIG